MIEAEPKKEIKKKKEKVKVDPEKTVDTERGAEIMDHVIAESEPIIPRELNREQIADLRASILKAQESGDAIDLYGGVADAKQEKIELEQKQIEQLKQELREQKTIPEQQSVVTHEKEQIPLRQQEPKNLWDKIKSSWFR